MTAATPASPAGRRWPGRRSGGPVPVEPRREPIRPVDPGPAPAPLVLSPDVMSAALADGTATPLTPIVTSLVRYRDRWWLDAVDEWLQITDPAFAASLDLRRSMSHQGHP